MACMSGLDELLQDFLAECHEGLDQVDGDLVRLESAPDDRSVLDRVFRTLHTIKGNCGFLNFTLLGDLAHAGETLLDRMRHGALEFSPETCDCLLGLVDALRSSLKHISKNGEESSEKYAELKQQLREMAATAPRPVRRDAADTEPEFGTMVSDDFAGLDATSFDAEFQESSGLPEPEVEQPSEPEPAKSSGAETPPAQPATPTGPSEQAVVKQQVDSPPAAEDEPPVTSKREEPPASTSRAKPTTQASETPATRSRPEPKRGADSADSGSSPGLGLSASNVRVDVELLDDLMNLVGELVLTRNQIVQRMSQHSDTGLLAHAQRLNGITTELQERFMKTRMQRIGSVWQRFPRVVRDVSRQCAKRVKLEMEGEETELDRTLLEAIADPLTHIIRNAIDHGIEPPAQRRRDGKPEVGVIKLRAYYEGGQVNVEVVDDGAGLDPERIREKAVQKQIFDEEESVMLSQSELLQSVFLPGFSTAESITSVSGRGVGMDVVKTNIEQIGGTVNLESTPGEGTTVRMKVPLTLAIIPALIVKASGHRFAIPQVNVLELFSLTPDDATSKIEQVHRTLVYRLRGNLIPLIELAELLGIRSDSPLRNRHVDVVVLQVHDRRLGLIVDDVMNNEVIVVKPLSPMIQDVPAYAGATILGDGQVSLILDGSGIARMTNVFASQQQRLEHASETDSSVQLDFSDGLLVCSLPIQNDGSPPRRVAFSLADVRMIRQFPVEDVSHAAGQLAVQYEDEILPLIDVTNQFFAWTPPEPEDGLLRVVICGTNGSTVGLIVDRVLDIAATPKNIRPAERPEFAGSAIIDGQITDILKPSLMVSHALLTE